ncbi:secreted protein of Ly-6 domain 1-like [Dama dama]|uniref:secreted protein of Ly-6 domain 1-like n=1 Tax=Dama dama TaxID=30532 RepID=UPI002A35B5A0|nr:secreted protein of Ly-6 domain 1-like [Dama dama]
MGRGKEESFNSSKCFSALVKLSPCALECFQCHRVNASGVCESTGGTCQTKENQQCFLRKIYEGGKLSYGHQGCSQLCIPMKLFNFDITVEYKCCQDSPLCNKF